MFYKKCLLGLGLLFLLQESFAVSDTCQSVTSGDWSDPTVWTGPACSNNSPPNDSNVTIVSGHSILLDVDTAQLNNLIIEVGGDFDIDFGSKGLSLNTNSPATTTIDLSNTRIDLSGDFTINGNAHSIILGEVLGSFDLTINSSDETRFEGVIGNPLNGGLGNLTSLTTDAPGTSVFANSDGSLNTPNIIVDGPRIFNDPVSIFTHTHIKGIGGPITFNGTINSDSLSGFRSLYLANIGNTVLSFNQDVGVDKEISEFRVFNSSGASIEMNMSIFKTKGTQLWGESMVLNSPIDQVTLESTSTLTDRFIQLGNAGKTVRSAIGNPNSLLIQSPNNSVALRSTLGDNAQALTNLTIVTSQQIFLDTLSITTTGNQSLTGGILLQQNTVLNADQIIIQDNIDNAGFNLTLNNANTVNASSMNGSLSGTGSLIKNGAGILEAYSNNPLTGMVTINAGGINNATTTASVFPSASVFALGQDTDSELGATNTNLFQLKNGQTIIGNGTCSCRLLALDGSMVSPGDTTSNSPSILFFDEIIMFNASVFTVELFGPISGADYDQIVAGFISLSSIDGNAVLNLELNYLPTIGQTFTLINNVGVSATDSTFANLLEGQQISISDVVFSISYTGGDGNDVVLTVESLPNIYVKKGSKGNGMSWNQALGSLQDALLIAEPGMDIWVAQGVYYPDDGSTHIGNDQSETFILKDGVSIYGGFNGTETALEQRDPAVNLTVLSGDITQNDENTDGNFVAEVLDDVTGPNSYRILTGGAVDTSTVLDGFTITAGSADEPGFSRGAGMYCGNNTTGPSLNQVKFISNFASDRGSATFGCSQMVTNSSFINNRSNDLAGAVLAYGGVYENVVFSGNLASRTGGALRNNNGQPISIKNSTFIANRSTQDKGGAIYSTGVITMENVLISGNKAGTNSGASQGGGLYINNSHAELTNVTFTGNYANDLGGAIGMTSTSTLNIQNSIIWNNQDSTGITSSLSSIYMPSGAVVNNSYSLIQGFGTVGTGNLDENPQFVFATNANDAPTSVGNFHLKTGSPAIAQGNDSLVTTALDLDGNTRIVDTVEMGAYEFASSSISVNVSGLLGSLVLQNNGGDDLIVNSNGSSTFSLETERGGSYNVTIFNQSTSVNQDCVLSNASGVVANTPITDIKVNCTIIKYRVGVDVDGLANGNSVEFENNGEGLIVSLDGQFNFATALDDGSAYEVTITSQPTTPSQMCSVVSNTGNLSGSDILLTVTCTTNQYLVGGMASGLAGGNSVTLSLGAEDLNVTSNAAFVFMNSLTDETNYSVSVFVQPTVPNQSCELVNPTGTIAGNDVMNLEVNCLTNQYKIGGTVTGLHSDNNLVLQNNGGDDLIITNSGDFDFFTSIDDLQGYNVSIFNQASNPIQYCAISNNSGNVAGNHVTSVSVVCEFGDDLIYRGGFE